MAQTAATALAQAPLPYPAVPWIDKATGKPADPFRNWAATIDAMMRQALFGTLINAVNDAAAAALGVPINGFYRNGSVVMIRVV